MFELITMEDDIKIKPHRFNEDIENAVTRELNQKLANKGFLNFLKYFSK